MVTVATFDLVNEAHIARGFLEAHGIPAVVAHEEAARLYAGTRAWPIELQVDERDEEAARGLLASVKPPEAGG